MDAKYGDSFLARRTSTERHCFMCTFKDWLLTRNQTFPIKDSNEFWTQFKTFIKTDGATYAGDLGWTKGSYGDQVVQYCAMYFEIFTDIRTLSLQQKSDLYDYLNSIIRIQNLQSPPEVSSGFITDGVFVDMVSAKALLSTAIFGVCTSLVVAIIVLIIATMNIVMSIYAIFSIILVLMVLTCFVYLSGYAFGLLESVAFTIVVGFSIDYSVHLGIAYMNQLKHSLGKPHRITLVKGTVAEIGSTILGGAITTATSVLPLFFCQITFFTKFGQFVFVNIAASFIVTFTILLSILLMKGPRGYTGDISHFIQHIRSLLIDEDEVAILEQEMTEKHRITGEDDDEFEDVEIKDDTNNSDEETIKGNKRVKFVDEPDVSGLVL
eukprot:TRINITY_DN640_c1_g1_i1.p1 TRINITY_DN640_c1_g1~~TRINITY_DN640_c1_g1_i1.p1  ORF type:complete len:380 (-),score=48.66 TRINITY_DN640_c1_g1_i1:47-1186(-)